MLKIEIPGEKPLIVAHLVLDYNGTLALDGELLPGVAEGVQKLSDSVQVHVLTADTHGTVADKVKHLPVTLAVIGRDRQDEEKVAYVRRLGAAEVVAAGNGRNDILMLAEARLGVGILQQEGANVKTIMAADVLCTSIVDVFGLLLTPARLQATLRC